MGFFGDRRVELVRGDVLLVTINPPHAVSAELVGEALRSLIPPGICVRSQQALDVSTRSQPQPDVAVVEGSLRDYANAHPTPALLVVEISDTTLHHDRVTKAHIYARASIAEYWIVNLIDRQVEVHRAPRADSSKRGRFRYASIDFIPATGTVSPLFAPQSQVAVADLLP
jgi:Uma2 family endonuclease